MNGSGRVSLQTGEYTCPSEWTRYRVRGSAGCRGGTEGVSDPSLRGGFYGRGWLSWTLKGKEGVGPER